MEKDHKEVVFNSSSFLEAKEPLLTHRCTSCGKGFSSGKALGGHKRYHIQQERLASRAVQAGDTAFFRKTNEFKIKLKNHIAPREDEGDKTMLCYHCGKDFPSLKSLSGHMRSHPERHWRGIHPPIMVVSNRVSCSNDAQKPKLDIDEDEDDDVDEDEDDDDDDDCDDTNKTVSTAAISAVNLLEVLPESWSKTDRRGRKGNPIVAAADGLINLSRAAAGDWCLEKKIKVRAVSENSTLLRFSTSSGDGTFSSSEEKQVLINEPCGVSMEKKKKTKYCLEEKKRKSASICGRTETDQESVSNKKKIITTTNLFKCRSCEKSFSTFQALGGHRSTHNKDNKTTSTTNKKEFQVVETMNSKLTNICGESEEKVFLNGTTTECLDRQLRGPRDVIGLSPTQLADLSMTDDDLIALSSEVDAPRGSSSTKTAGRIMLDFDLNELPSTVSVGDELKAR